MNRMRISAVPGWNLLWIAGMYAMVLFRSRDITFHDFTVNHCAVSSNTTVYVMLVTCILLFSITISCACYTILFKLKFSSRDMSVLYLVLLLCLRHFLPLLLLQGIRVDEIALIDQQPGLGTLILFAYWYFLCIDVLIKWFGFSAREAFGLRLFNMHISFSLRHYYILSVVLKILLAAFPLYRCYARIVASPLYMA